LKSRKPWNASLGANPEMMEDDPMRKNEPELLIGNKSTLEAAAKALTADE